MKIKIVHEGEVNRARYMPKEPVRLLHPTIFCDKFLFPDRIIYIVLRTLSLRNLPRLRYSYSTTLSMAHFLSTMFVAHSIVYLATSKKAMD